VRRASLLVALLLAGCGGDELTVAAPAELRSLELDWREEAPELVLAEGIHSARTPTEGAVMSERTSLTDEEIRTDVVQEIREETADADMDDTDADTDDTDSDSDETDA
jgi:hypothetical protein